MPYGNWRILVEETFKEYGYYPDSLTNGSHKPIKVECEMCGLKTIRAKRFLGRYHRCPSIIGGKKRCFKCKRWLELTEFSKNRHTFDGFQKVCKSCFASYKCVVDGYNKKSALIKTDIETYFKYKCHNTKSRIKHKNLDFDIDGEFLLSLYRSQGKKCYYSGVPIYHNTGLYNFNSISIERLNPDKGYTRDNVVLCAFGMNSFKGSMTEQEFKKILRQVIPSLSRYAGLK